MNGIIGYGFTSPIRAQTLLRKRLVRWGRSELEVSWFLSVRDFSTFRNKEVGKLAVIFDSPMRLADIDGLLLMDARRVNTVFFEQRKTVAEDYAKVRQMFDQPPVKVHTKVTQTIQELIKVNTYGRFLNYFNSLLYSVTNVSLRAQYKEIILSFLFEQTTRVEFERKFRELIKRKNSKSDVALTAMLDYFGTEIGESFLAALRHVMTQRSPCYDEIAEKFGSDPYELRYLHKTFSSNGTG